MMGPMAALLVTPMASSVIETVTSSLINTITGKGVWRARKGQEVGFLSLLSVLLLLKGPLEKESLIKFFSPAPFFNQYRD